MLCPRMTTSTESAAKSVHLAQHELGRSPVEFRHAWCVPRAPLWRNCARSGQTAGGTPLLESFDVCVGERQCAMRNVGLARLVEHEAQDVLDLRLATAFDVT